MNSQDFCQGCKAQDIETTTDEFWTVVPLVNGRPRYSSATVQCTGHAAELDPSKYQMTIIK